MACIAKSDINIGNYPIPRYMNPEGLDRETWMLTTTVEQARRRIVTQLIKNSSLSYFDRVRKDERLWK